MDWRWDWIWSILWNAFIHAVSFQWSELSSDGESLKSWWRSFWGAVDDLVCNAKRWAQDWFDWLKAQIDYWYNRATSYAYDKAMWAYNTALSAVNNVRSWADGWINWLKQAVSTAYNQAIQFARAIGDSVEQWARNYIDSLINWLQSRYGWILSYRDLIASWLVNARSTVDWLVNYGRATLQAFLGDPVGFVLGSWVTWLRTIIGFWQAYGSSLMTFVAQDLSDLRTTWVNGKVVIKALVQDPGRFILDYLTPLALDWLEELLADNW